MEVYKKIKTLIVGKRSFISQELNRNIFNSKLVATDEFKLLYLKQYKNIKINLIINSFFPSTNLNKIKNYEYYFNKSILDLSKILDVINPKKINKIIYTSSASVYGSVNDNHLNKDFYNRNLYSYTKLCCENLIKNYCDKFNTNFIITRVFNCYGNNSNFSIINKIKNTLKNRGELIINNRGNSIRDYVHVKDVAKIYNILLKKFYKGTFDVGSGEGIKIIDLLNKINFPKNKIKFKDSYNKEIKFSVANLSSFKNKINNIKFKSIESFFNIKKKRLKKYVSENVNQLTFPENNLVIYGAGFAGKKIGNKLVKSKNENLIFFIDDDNEKIGKKILNKKIISFNSLLKLSKNTVINKILIAIPSLSEDKILEIYEKLLPITKNISVLPSKDYFKNKEITLSDLIDLKIEEILNRKIFQPNRKYLAKYRKKNILITGGAGSIGSEICKQLLIANPSKLLIVDQSEYNLYQLNQKLNDKKIKSILLDINETKMLRKIIKKYKIDYIFHAAAYKHVKFLENNFGVAIKNNTLGTLSVIEASKKLKVKITIISTDKAVKPTSVLGMTKRAAEIMSLNYIKDKSFINTKLNVVRFGNVFGSQGSAIETFINQIKENKEITITSYKMKRYFMSIREACNLVIQSSALNYRNKIFILDMGKQLKIIDLIKKILKLYDKSIFDYKIKKIGAIKGEKISELLTHSSKKIKTSVNKLIISKEKIANLKNFEKILYNLKKNINDNYEKKSISIIKKIIRS